MSQKADRRPGLKQWLLLVAVLAAAPLTMADSCGTGTGGTPPGAGPVAPGGSASPAKQTIFAVGQPMVASDGKAVTVDAFKRNYDSGNQFEQPAAGKECVRVAYSLRNGSKTEWSLPTFELSVLDANGQKYSTSFSCGSSDNVEALVAGGVVSAGEIYEVPVGIALDALWQPNVFETTVYQTHLK